jgi:tRNA pseudouridine38-40 synthase
MARYQVILAYDGTRFLGFQRQAEARTVQAEVEKALRQLNWDGSNVLAAGRTDTGVHASGQVISFDLDWRHPTDELLRALNAYLPEDVAAREVTQAAADFHPRYDATSRKYLYRIYCQPTRHPLMDRYAWRVWPASKLEVLQEEAGYLPGMHDFAAFGTPPRSGGSTTRTIYQAFWRLHEPYLEFVVTADAFLYHMVRRLVSLQVEIGQGRLPPESVLKYILRQAEAPLQGLAPSRGLSLVEVSYKQRNKSDNRKAELEKYDLYEDGNQ